MFFGHLWMTAGLKRIPKRAGHDTQNAQCLLQQSRLRTSVPLGTHWQEAHALVAVTKFLKNGKITDMTDQTASAPNISNSVYLSAWEAHRG